MTPWSPAEDSALVRLRAQGLTWAGVAGSVPGRTPGACAARWVRVVRGRPAAHRHRWTPEEDGEACRMLASGATLGEVADRFGVTRDNAGYRNRHVWRVDVSGRGAGPLSAWQRSVARAVAGASWRDGCDAGEVVLRCACACGVTTEAMRRELPGILRGDGE